MGKGFNNYMTKKFFHPGSKDNIKRVWMAEQKDEYDKKKQEELLTQYHREQEMLSNRALLGDEKAKLGLSFMYDAPPGAKKEKEKEDDEPEYRFEWQRKYNAPRESYAKGNEEIRDQPFGIEVRNVRCIKCHQWGHVNTDKICPLFGKNITAEPPQPGASTSTLVDDMRGDGLKLKTSILTGMTADPSKANERMIEEEDPEVQFLKSLSKKQKKKLLKKLDKLSKKGDKSKKKKHKKKDSDSDSQSSGSENEKANSSNNRHDRVDRRREGRSRSPGLIHDRQRARSPPQQRTRSPQQRTWSPQQRTRSPPQQRTRSPPQQRTRSPLQQRTRSPWQRLRSSRSPRQRSRSPRQRSRSPRQRSRSPFRRRNYGQSGSPPRHRRNSGSPDRRDRKRRSRSPEHKKNGPRFNDSDRNSHKRKGSNSPNTRPRKKRNDSSGSNDSRSPSPSRRCKKDENTQERQRYHSYDRRSHEKQDRSHKKVK